MIVRNIRNQVFYVNSREKSGSHVSFAKLPGHLGKHIGIPSMLAGYQYLYNNLTVLTGIKTSRYSWKRLFSRNIKLAKNGFPISMTLQHVLHNIDLATSPWRLSIDRTMLMSPVLGNFLRRIARNGPKRTGSYYAPGSMDQKHMLRELHSIGSGLTAKDLSSYRVKRSKSFATRCLGYRVDGIRLPGSGVLILFGCKLLETAIKRHGYLAWSPEKRFLYRIRVLHTIYSLQPHLNQLQETGKVPNKWVKRLFNRDSKLFGNELVSRLNGLLPIRVVESIGKLRLNMSQVRENIETEHGTSNICIRDSTGTTVCATSTINWGFGTRYASKRFGFFYNNQLSDFTYNNPYSFNRPRPNRYPRSSISPTLFRDQVTGKLEFALGAAGGRKILASIFIVMADMIEQKLNNHNRTNWNGYDCYKSQNRARCTFHLKPNYRSAYTYMECENHLQPRYKNILTKHGALVRYTNEAGYSSVTLISKNNNCFDPRRGGSVYVSN